MIYCRFFLSPKLLVSCIAPFAFYTLLTSAERPDLHEAADFFHFLTRINEAREDIVENYLDQGALPVVEPVVPDCGDQLQPVQPTDYSEVQSYMGYQSTSLAHVLQPSAHKKRKLNEQLQQSEQDQKSRGEAEKEYYQCPFDSCNGLRKEHREDLRGHLNTAHTGCLDNINIHKVDGQPEYTAGIYPCIFSGSCRHSFFDWDELHAHHIKHANLFLQYGKRKYRKKKH